MLKSACSVGSGQSDKGDSRHDEVAAQHRRRNLHTSGRGRDELQVLGLDQGDAARRCGHRSGRLQDRLAQTIVPVLEVDAGRRVEVIWSLSIVRHRGWAQGLNHNVAGYVGAENPAFTLHAVQDTLV